MRAIQKYNRIVYDAITIIDQWESYGGLCLSNAVDMDDSGLLFAPISKRLDAMTKQYQHGTIEGWFKMYPVYIKHKPSIKLLHVDDGSIASS